MTTQGMLADADKIDQLRIERDLAQSACGAWRDVFEGIEAHLQDRIAMHDQSSPETYLSIIRSAVENVYRDSQAIVNSRWTDSAHSQRHIARLEQELAEIRHDWHMTFVGSDIRLMIQEIERCRAALAQAQEPGEDTHKQLRALWLALDGGPKPLCRDCADHYGNCPSSGLPCDPQERALAQIKTLRAPPPQVDSGREDVTIPLEFIRNCGCPSDRRMTVGECTDRGTCGCSLTLRQMVHRTTAVPATAERSSKTEGFAT